jgi:hypothetical protein
MTVDELNELLIEATRTELSLMPAVRKPRFVCWPEYPGDWHAYASADALPPRFVASPEQITRLDWALVAVLILPVPARRLVWAAAFSAAFRGRGPAWSTLAKRFHCDRRTVKRRYKQCLEQIVVAGAYKQQSSGPFVAIEPI